MASGQYARVFSSGKCSDISCNITQECILCVHLEKELIRAQSELKSAREIIRLLEEERNFHLPVPTRSRPNYDATETWTKVCNGYRGGKVTCNYANEGIRTVNRYSPLQEEKERRKKREEIRQPEERRTLIQVKCSNTSSKQVKPSVSKSKNHKHKVIVIGDSHARGCASEINSKTKDVLAYGVVKPGRCLDDILDSAKVDIKTLTKEDAVIVWGGTNDVGKNNSDKGQNYLETFVEENVQTNIVVMSAPHRHDLDKSSCVNDEVVRFNRKIKKRMKIHDHVKVVDLNLKRNHFTRHGLHMNYRGKEEAANSIIATIDDIFTRNEDSIALQWKANSLYTEKKEDLMDQETTGTATRTSGRLLKTPNHLQDFLCPNAPRRRPC